jgi:hypothetical protein
VGSVETLLAAISRIVVQELVVTRSALVQAAVMTIVSLVL